MFVANTEKLNPVMLVKAKLNFPPVSLAPPKTDLMGEGMLKGELVAEVNEPALNTMVAPMTELVLKAVKPVKADDPETAAFVVVPPSAHVPTPTEATMLDVAEVMVLPY